jgi:predicted metal-dependent phosphoesterase TrpH
MKVPLHRSSTDPARRRSRRESIPTGRADLHVHTAWSDGAQRPAAVVDAAAGRVEVLAITDHDEIRGALEAHDYAAAHPELGVEVVVGEEISTLNGHVIGLWLGERIPPGLTAERTIDEIHAQGGLPDAPLPCLPYRGQAPSSTTRGRRSAISSGPCR